MATNNNTTQEKPKYPHVIEIKGQKVTVTEEMASRPSEAFTNLLELQAVNECLRRFGKPSQKGLRVSAKKAVSLYGMKRFPITEYAETWLKVLDMADEIRAFIEANKESLSWKDSE